MRRPSSGDLSLKKIIKNLFGTYFGIVFGFYLELILSTHFFKIFCRKNKFFHTSYFFKLAFLTLKENFQLQKQTNHTSSMVKLILKSRFMLIISYDHDFFRYKLVTLFGHEQRDQNDVLLFN